MSYSIDKTTAAAYNEFLTPNDTKAKHQFIAECVALVDSLKDVYASNVTSPTQFPDVDNRVGLLAEYAQGTGRDAQLAQACLSKAALLGYPLAQFAYASLLKNTKSEFNKQLSGVLFALLMDNPAAPEHLKDAVPPGATLRATPSQTLEQLAQQEPIQETALTNSWLLTRGEKWKNNLASITGIENPDHFIKGTNTAALACVPFLMLGLYNLPVADCVNAEYINDIYTSTENKEKFYNTVANYRLPRFSWIDRVKVPVMGLLSKLHLSNDFKSEGHKMCAAADIIVMLLCKDLYHETAEGLDARKPLALDTLTKMAKNGFPAAQLALSVYLRQCGVKENNAAKITKACFWANKAKENDYTTSNEKAYINDNHLLETSLTEKEQAVRAAAKESRAQKMSRHDEPASISTRIQRIKPNPRSAKVTRINPRQGKGQGE
ncbi:MAG: hypothetical protein ILP11_02330 [Alphaproteobacteria bacterium]|nr:hypothetical protein [Alphaproteobacteria bacterium]